MTIEQYGLVVAADALGNMIFSPIFGLISDKMNSVRFTGLVTAGTFALGNAMYALISVIPREGVIPNQRVWFCLLSRLIVGVGTAVNAASRGYISKVTTVEERTTHIAMISLFQTLGLILGPAFQAALTPIGEKEISENSDIVLDMYTATG